MAFPQTPVVAGLCSGRIQQIHKHKWGVHQSSLPGLSVLQAYDTGSGGIYQLTVVMVG